MKHLKLFEELEDGERKNKILLDLVKNAIISNRKELYDLAIKRGFDIQLNYTNLLYSSVVNDNYIFLKDVIGVEKYNKFFTQEGKVKDYGFFHIKESSTHSYDFYNISISESSSLNIYVFTETKNGGGHIVPSIEYEYLHGDDDEDGGYITIMLHSSHPNASFETNTGFYYRSDTTGHFIPGEIEKLLDSFVSTTYPNLEESK